VVLPDPPNEEAVSGEDGRDQLSIHVMPHGDCLIGEDNAPTKASIARITTTPIGASPTLSYQLRFFNAQLGVVGDHNDEAASVRVHIAFDQFHGLRLCDKLIAG
jgi:hypothetical protein